MQGPIETARTDEHPGSDLSAAFGIAIALLLGIAFQVGIFLVLRTLWEQFAG